MNSKSKLLAPELVNAERPVWAFSKKIFCEGMRDGVPLRWAILLFPSRWALRPAGQALPRFRAFWSAY